MSLLDPVENRRAVIDRRTLSGRLAGVSGAEAANILQQALEAGRAEIAGRRRGAP